MARHEMKVLVTGSSGHLGEALVRTLRARGDEVIGLDISPSPYTDVIGSVADPACVRESMRGAEVVQHAATLHKPHIVTHTKQEFIDTNVSGTLCLLEEALHAGIKAFVFTSSTSVFGDALRPPEGHPAAWITEDVSPIPKNIYGVTKMGAENLCELFSGRYGLASVVLRTSRFFPEEDDDATVRREYQGDNVKANEFLFRRVDLEDVVDAHIRAAQRAQSIRFGRFIVSATTPFRPEDLQELRRNAAAVVERRVPKYAEIYGRLGWRMFPHIDRVYVNERARSALDWDPKHSFAKVIERLRNNGHPRSRLASEVGAKGYHSQVFEHGPYPVE
jgi:UDP-glucose 4-epimerase